MVNKGTNPFIEAFDGVTCFDEYELAKLSNLPPVKSVYFTTQPLANEFKGSNEFESPWYYSTGIFGEFNENSMIGRGASGIVLKGEWFGNEAAFKFVDIGSQVFSENVSDNLRKLNEKLSEMTSIQSTEGSKIVKFLGHYR